MTILNKIHFTGISIGISLLAALIIIFILKNWEKPDRVIEHDVYHYYAYLPASIIYHDITLKKSNYYFWTLTTNDGRKVFKMTMGLSYLYAPFFFIAHYTAGILEYETNGKSIPYKFFLLLSAIFYLVIGLVYLSKILKQFKFADSHIAVTILLIGIGTNLLAYSSQSAPMPHVYNFCLINMFVYYSLKWISNPSILLTVVLGLLIGLIALIRPTNSIIIIVLFMAGIRNIADFKHRIIQLSQLKGKLLLMAIIACIVWIPQLLYWKSATGHYFFYSYIGERFFFNDPKIWQGVFSWRKGWLLYTPMMSFALIGIFFMKDQCRSMLLPVSVFLVLNLYIIFSWWCWWYGGTFGQRTMIDSYGVLAIPFACFVKFVMENKLFYRLSFFILASFFVFLNIFQMFQFENRSLHYDGMNKKLYFEQFLKMRKTENFDQLIHYPNYEAALNGSR